MSLAFEQILKLSKELTDEERLKVVAYLQQPIGDDEEDEDEWESHALRTVLAKYIDEDGVLNRKKLRDDAVPMSLEELRPKDENLE